VKRSYNKKKLNIGNSKVVEKTNICKLSNKIFDKLALGINPPADMLVNARLTESRSLKFAKLYKNIIKIVDAE
tara:strand:+ start:252 stop:470 length:219 start_codon:yes stop_codon:yes gene_type:complete